MGNSKTKWRFSFSVLLPVMVAVLLTVGTAAGFIIWSTTKSDDRALERQSRLVSHILSKERDHIVEELADVSPWDEAVLALENGIDKDWVDENLGAGFYENYEHHRIYVLDPQLRPVYAMHDGGAAPRESFEASGETIRALVAKLQTAQSRSAILSKASRPSSVLFRSSGSPRMSRCSPIGPSSMSPFASSTTRSPGN
jgi:sensor domain CHASE-containing protein